VIDGQVDKTKEMKERLHENLWVEVYDPNAILWGQPFPMAGDPLLMEGLGPQKECDVGCDRSNQGGFINGRIPSRWDLEHDPLNDWHHWIEADGSFVTRITNAPHYLRVMPWEAGSFSLRYAVTQGWLDPGLWNQFDWSWDVCLTQFDFVGAISSPSRDRSRFLDRIDVDIWQSISRYQYLQLEMLRLAASYEAAAQLAVSTPNLLWLVAEALVMGKVSVNKLNHLLSLRRHEILSRLFGRPIHKSGVKLLGKFVTGTGSQFSQSNMQALKVVLTERYLHLFRHWSRVTPSVIRGANIHGETYIRCLYSVIVYREVQFWEALMAEFSQLWRDLLFQSRHSVERQAMISQLTDATQVRCHHQRWTETDNSGISSLHYLSAEDVDDPFPKLNFNEAIWSSMVRLKTPRSLYLEGHKMHHCVSGYKSTAQSIGDAFFSVTTPEDTKLTLRIVWWGQEWKMSQLKGMNNRSATPSEVQYIECWLKVVNDSLITNRH